MKSWMHYNLRSGFLFFAAGRNAKFNHLTIRLLLVQNLDFTLIGEETKGTYVELSHDWLPVWQ